MINRVILFAFHSEDIETTEYSYHPINAYHLLQRTSKWLPKLQKLLPKLKIGFNLPNNFDANIGSAVGISDLQEYHNLDPMDIIQGKIYDHFKKKFFYSKSNLTSSDVLKIASTARDSNYLDNYVTWLQNALILAKIEGKNEKTLKMIK